MIVMVEQWKWMIALRKYRIVELKNKKEHYRFSKNYVLPFHPKKYYPRYHILVEELHYDKKKKLYMTILNVHIDWKRHRESQSDNMMITNFVNMIRSI